MKLCDELLEEFKGLVDVWPAVNLVRLGLIFILVDGHLFLRSFDQVRVGDDFDFGTGSAIIGTLDCLFLGLGHFLSGNIGLFEDNF